MSNPINGLQTSSTDWIQSFTRIMTGVSRGNSGGNVDRGIFNGGVRATGGTGDVSSFSNADISNIQTKINELKAKKEENLQEIERLKQEIEQLTREADAKRDEANKKTSESSQKSNEAAQEKENAESKASSATDKYKSDTKAAAQEAIDKYNADKKAGKSVTEDDLQQGINSAVDSVSTDGIDIAQKSADKAQNLQIEAVDLKTDAVSLKSEESALRSKIDADKSKIESLTQENLQIDEQIAMLEAALQAAQSSASNGSSSNSSGSSDPIGFDVDGESYEFIVDDGSFDETSDFLGFDNQWEAMQQLDKDGNGSVDLKELQEGNIKVVNSKGEVGDIEKLFGSDFSVDLKSYDKNGTYDKLDSADHDGDGTKNQELLGTFNVNIGGKSVQGHNTLDDNEYLSGKYGIKDSGAAAPNASSGNIKSSPFDTENKDQAIKPNSKFQQRSFGTSDSSIEKAKQEMDAFKNSLISNPFETTGRKEEENQEENKKKHNIFS